MYRRRSKFHNQPCTHDGHRFSSQAEGKRYLELKLLLRAGTITGLRLQPRFKFPFGVTYVGDFQYLERGATVVEDVKGFATEAFKIKAKAFRYYYPEIVLRVLKI